MKKALTIYIDDDCKLTNYCATFILKKEKDTSVIMQNISLDGTKDALHLPFVVSPRHEAILFTEGENENPDTM